MLTPPSQIAHYKITLKLGEGGMGAVYRATDTKLGREVAIKILPDSFAVDPDRVARFAREAQVLASLNHPNIATIYGIEEAAIIMELVEGEDIRGPVSMETAIAYARQIAIALEAAHEKAIVHRDLKPANIKVTPDGVVKLLDFGLAKAIEERSISAASPTMSPTLSLAMTQAGMILGTAAYMSPEQARGKQVDKRADIWAFGVVLFELLTGRHLYGGGETVTDTLAAVVLTEPDYSALPKDTPPRIRRLLERCLRKDPKLRLRDIGEARLILDEAEPQAAATRPLPVRRPFLPWAVAALFAVGLAAAVPIAWRARNSTTPPQFLRLSVSLPPDTSLDVNNSGPIALSADGTRIALALRRADGKSQIYTRSLQDQKLVPVTGTEGAAGPFFSPDGKWLGFIDLSAMKLKKIPVEGGAALSVCDAPSPRGAAWEDDDSIVAAPDSVGGLVRVSSAGTGLPQLLTPVRATERTQRWPQVLPRSRGILFTSHSANSDYNHATIDVVITKTGERRTLIRDGFAGRYINSGHLVYIRQSTLFAVPFDLDKLQVSGRATPVLNQILNGGTMGGVFAISQNGLAVYVEADSRRHGISWVDEAGVKSVLLESPGVIAPSFSPDGTRLAFSPNSAAGADLWVKDLVRDHAARLSFTPGYNSSPVWTPDGNLIVFLSATAHSEGKLYWIRSTGAGGAQALSDLSAITPHSISPDGKRLAVTRVVENQGTDLFTIPITGTPDHPNLGQPELFLGTPAMETQPAFSPDGHWIAYASNESGTFEVYVRPFPGPGGRWQISTGGGRSPAWSRKGHDLLYETLARGVMRVEYSAHGDSFAPGRSRPWPMVELADMGTNVAFDVSPDGKHLAAILPEVGATGAKQVMELTILVNFFEDVKNRLNK